MSTSDDLAFLAALQLADSAMPIGRFVHSHGMESWLADKPNATECEITVLVHDVVAASVAPLDGVILAHAHAARTVEAICALDRALTARKLTPPARAASHSSGRRLAAIAPKLSADELIRGYAHAVLDGDADGNIAVVEGVLGRALGLSVRHTVLLELRGVVAGLLSAAVRLGRLTPTEGQLAMRALAPGLAEAASRALRESLDGMFSAALTVDIHALRHHRSETRFFAT